MIFLDKIVIDLKRLHASSVKLNTGRVGTLILALTLRGEMIRSLFVLPKESMCFNMSQYLIFMYSYAASGLVDESTFAEWYKIVLSRFSPRFIVSQEYEFLFSETMTKYLRSIGIQCISYPRGVGCVLSPFKEISQILIRNLNESAKKVAPEGDSDEPLLEWIAAAFARMFADDPNVIGRAFEVLLN